MADPEISSPLFTDLERWSCARLALEFLKARVVVPEGVWLLHKTLNQMGNGRCVDRRRLGPLHPDSHKAQ